VLSIYSLVIPAMRRLSVLSNGDCQAFSYQHSPKTTTVKLSDKLVLSPSVSEKVELNYVYTSNIAIPNRILLELSSCGG
jgi:hypothetical protein